MSYCNFQLRKFRVRCRPKQGWMPKLCFTFCSFNQTLVDYTMRWQPRIVSSYFDPKSKKELKYLTFMAFIIKKLTICNFVF